MDNLVTIAIIVFVLWLISFAVYIYATRQQTGIEQDIQEVEALLNKLERDSS